MWVISYRENCHVTRTMHEALDSCNNATA